MRMRRELQLAPNQSTKGGLYHVVSRVVWREFIFGEEEKAYFYGLMRKYEKFCGVEVQSYCLMSNHFHMLIRVPARPTAIMGDETFFKRMRLIYSDDIVVPMETIIGKLRKDAEGFDENGQEDIEKIIINMKEPYLNRMWNLSEFIKVIKQRFTRWYNRKNGKTGTLWEGRFKSQLVQGGHAARMTAAYIDLNPIRAGMVDDPKDYRWCSYGEAVAGGKLAQKGLLALMNKRDMGVKIEVDQSLTRKDALARYRVLLAEEGGAVEEDTEAVLGESYEKLRKRRKGFSKEEVEQIIESDGKLSWSQVLRCKTRYFSDGLVIGTKQFVESYFQDLKEKTGHYEKRETGARKIRQVDNSQSSQNASETTTELFTMRDLTKDRFL